MQEYNLVHWKVLSTQRPLAAGSGQTRWSSLEGGLWLGEEEKSQVRIRVESTSTEIFDSAAPANPACIEAKNPIRGFSHHQRYQHAGGESFCHLD
jgi:hypothetical protein